ncbi:MAG TPA: ABC transporter permease [Vicinamibacterales bacterium]|nr:ABC transporter permease [Vicinamibacterales bacterium]
MLNDLRYSWRQLRRTPGFTLVAIITLALGIASNTTFFGLINAAVWRPMRAIDFTDSYDVYLYRPPRQRTPAERIFYTQRPLTMPQLEYLRSFPEMGIVAVAGVSGRRVIAQTAFDAQRFVMEITHGDYAGVTRMRPIIGGLAGLDNNGEQAGSKVVISERLWRSWFKGDPAAVGRDTLRINRTTFTVAGVAPAAQSARGTDLWMAAESWRVIDPEISKAIGEAQVRFRPGFEPARLGPMIDHALASGPTAPPEEFKTRMETGMPAQVQAGMSRMAWLVMGLSALVLLAACANLANMLYARAAQRTGEIAVRLSLGASTARVFRLFLLEAAIIAGLAAAAALALAGMGLRYVSDVLPGVSQNRYSGMPIIDISPDWRMFAYAVGAGAFAALVVGGLTAWRGSRTPPLRLFGSSGIAQSTSPRSKWTRTVLVAVQVSAAVVLLLGTGLYLVRALTLTPGSMAFETRRLATAQIEFDKERFNDTQVPDLLQRILTSVEQLDGIEAGAITDGMFGGEYSRAKSMRNLIAESDSLPGALSPRRLVTGTQAAVSPGFLDVLGLDVLTGRNLRPTDVDGAPEVVLISDSAAKKMWPDLEPLGKRVRVEGDLRWFTVVGTFEDPMRQGADTTTTCNACVALTSWAQMSPRREWLVVLRSTAPAVAIQKVRPAVDAVNSDVPVLNASVADRSIFSSANMATAFSGLAGTLGLVSLIIAALGIYGVISYSVSRRTREFGIRLALGATPSLIVRSVVDDAVHLVLVGLLPGVLLASWATRVLEASIVRLMPNDIPTWVIVPTVILAIGVFAGWIPARRAARVDPNVALRDL